MSVREEDRKKNNCPSRGLGIAAAAIGVGVGAALYYFFNKRQETPSSAGSSSEWNCEQHQTFRKSESDDSYTTISEHDTTDTSINTSVESDIYLTQDDSVITVESSSEEESTGSDSETESSSSTSAFTVVSNDLWDSTDRSSASEGTEWDITTSSHGIPEESITSPMLEIFGVIGNLISPRKRMTEEQQMSMLRQQEFRERSWTLEECSICFDVMLRDQEVTALPCAHNFHTECILPWLQEKQTCPNCRKVAE